MGDTMESRDEWAVRMQKEEHDMRVALIKAMNLIARCTNNEDLIDGWLMVGVPDGSTDEEIEEWADEQDTYLDFCEAFVNHMHQSKDVHDFFYYYDYIKKEE